MDSFAISLLLEQAAKAVTFADKLVKSFHTLAMQGYWRLIQENARFLKIAVRNKEWTAAVAFATEITHGACKMAHTAGLEPPVVLRAVCGVAEHAHDRRERAQAKAVRDMNALHHRLAVEAAALARL